MKLQSPRGTRDFYPPDMAWQNYLLDAWRRVSIRHGFEQIDGPVFEMLDLYKIKSGEGIVSDWAGWGCVCDCELRAGTRAGRRA